MFLFVWLWQTSKCLSYNVQIQMFSDFCILWRYMFIYNVQMVCDFLYPNSMEVCWFTIFQMFCHFCVFYRGLCSNAMEGVSTYIDWWIFWPATLPFGNLYLPWWWEDQPCHVILWKGQSQLNSKIGHKTFRYSQKKLSWCPWLTFKLFAFEESVLMFVVPSDSFKMLLW